MFYVQTHGYLFQDSCKSSIEQPINNNGNQCRAHRSISGSFLAEILFQCIQQLYYSCPRGITVSRNIRLFVCCQTPLEKLPGRPTNHMVKSDSVYGSTCCRQDDQIIAYKNNSLKVKMCKSETLNYSFIYFEKNNHTVCVSFNLTFICNV